MYTKREYVIEAHTKVLIYIYVCTRYVFYYDILVCDDGLHFARDGRDKSSGVGGGRGRGNNRDKPIGLIVCSRTRCVHEVTKRDSCKSAPPIHEDCGSRCTPVLCALALCSTDRRRRIMTTSAATVTLIVVAVAIVLGSSHTGKSGDHGAGACSEFCFLPGATGQGDQGLRA